MFNNDIFNNIAGKKHLKNNKKKSKSSDILTASEIGQYFFCPVAWYLQKKGFKPESFYLKKGKQKHDKIGKIMDNIAINERRSTYLAKIGYLIMIIVFIIILYEVLL